MPAKKSEKTGTWMGTYKGTIAIFEWPSSSKEPFTVSLRTRPPLVASVNKEGQESRQVIHTLRQCLLKSVHYKQELYIFRICLQLKNRCKSAKSPLLIFLQCNVSFISCNSPTIQLCTDGVMTEYNLLAIIMMIIWALICALAQPFSMGALAHWKGVQTGSNSSQSILYSSLCNLYNPDLS